jgi:hypothetical protein
MPERHHHWGAEIRKKSSENKTKMDIHGDAIGE